MKTQPKNLTCLACNDKTVSCMSMLADTVKNDVNFCVNTWLMTGAVVNLCLLLLYCAYIYVYEVTGTILHIHIAYIHTVCMFGAHGGKILQNRKNESKSIQTV